MMVRINARNDNLLHLLLAFAFVGILTTGCNRSGDKTPIKDVTGYAWNLGALRDAADPSISPLPATWQLTLRDDQTFSIDLSGVICKGTYSWNEIDSVSAHVNFSVKQWNDPIEYSSSAQKLKKVLSGIDRCYILKGINVPPLITGFTSPSIALDFEGNNCFVFWYR